MTVVTYDGFRATKHMRSLDGIRAIAILLVVASHMPEPWWEGLNGYAGVSLFFVLSGFLITTLALREEEERGRLSLGAFYIRRAFRIFPVYYAVLAAYVALVFSGVLDGRQQFTQNLPYYLTYMNELTGEGHYHQTWSLGVEEKFYLLWPLICFVVLAQVRRWRTAIAAAFLVVLVGVNQLGVVPYDIGLYTPILMGCLTALLLHHRRTFDLVARASRPALVVVVLLAFVAMHSLLRQVTNLGLVYAATACVLLAISVATSGFLSRSLGWRGWRYIAERSYSVYLVHALALLVVSIPFGGNDVDLPVPLALLRFVLAVVVSLAMAEVLWRLLERPLIRVGRRFSQRVLRDSPTGGDQPAPVGQTTHR